MFKKIIALLMVSGIFLYANSSSKGILLSKVVLKEQVQVNNVGQKVRKMVPTQKVHGGDILVYINRILSQSKVETKNVVIENMIPSETVYLRGTANCEGVCEILFSIDGGKSFQKGEELFVVYATQKRVAFGSEYTHIKYIFKSILPFTQTRMSFKAVVK